VSVVCSAGGRGCDQTRLKLILDKFDMDLRFEECHCVTVSSEQGGSVSRRAYLLIETEERAALLYAGCGDEQKLTESVAQRQPEANNGQSHLYIGYLSGPSQHAGSSHASNRHGFMCAVIDQCNSRVIVYPSRRYRSWIVRINVSSSSVVRGAHGVDTYLLVLPVRAMRRVTWMLYARKASPWRRGAYHEITLPRPRRTPS